MQYIITSFTYDRILTMALKINKECAVLDEDGSTICYKEDCLNLVRLLREIRKGLVK